MTNAQVPLAAVAGQVPEIEVDLQKGTLSVQINNMPPVNILKIIGDEVGFRLMMIGSGESRITQDFSNVPLSEGIRRLVGNRSVAMMYQIVDAPDDRKELQKIKEVWVFDSAGAADDGPVSDTQEEDPEIDVSAESSRTASPNDPGRTDPLQPDADGMKAAETYPPFDKESDVGYWTDRLVNSTDRSRREQAVTELERIGSDEAVAAIAIAFSDKDVTLRRHAVESLGRIDNVKMVHLLGQALLGDKDPSVRLSAVRYFADQNNEVSRAFLNTALKDHDEKVKALARQALENN
ncbi:MAG: HEAT repeat domain-containing protein [Syntrophaceae bacterium]|nr:HEAT repeat domain-containing protein [Syntrophaceae bacterium]